MPSLPVPVIRSPAKTRTRQNACPKSVPDEPPPGMSWAPIPSSEAPNWTSGALAMFVPPSAADAGALATRAIATSAGAASLLLTAAKRPTGGEACQSARVSEEAQLPELLVGRVVSVEEHPGARAPSYLLRLELGPRGEVETSVERGRYERGELEGAQVVVVLRGDEALVLAARSHAAGLVLLRPDREVEDGTVVS
jgi:tRNA-binding EMAP/Myf-like protein